MSYEGYEQLLCANGHAWAIDAYADAFEDDNYHPRKCHDCGGMAVWGNSVDETNGVNPDTDEGEGYVPLKMKTDIVYEECFHCKHSKIIANETFEIPSDKGVHYDTENTNGPCHLINEDVGSYCHHGQCDTLAWENNTDDNTRPSRPPECNGR